MSVNDLIKNVEAIIKNKEISNAQLTAFVHPRSPIAVIYTDEASAKAHTELVDSLQPIWKAYEKKIVFSQLQDDGNVKQLGGLAGYENGFDTLFTRDGAIDPGFNFNNCTSFVVTSSYNVKKAEEIYAGIKAADLLVKDVSNDRRITAYLVVFLDVVNNKNVSSEFRNACEKVFSKSKSACENAANEYVSNKKVFFVENRNSQGADLTDDISERKMFRNLSYIVRLSQLQGIGERIADKLHLIGSQEVNKPYYEMAAGTIAGVFGKISKYIAEHSEAISSVNATSEEIAAHLGFKENKFELEYVEQHQNELQRNLPSREALLSFPLAEPQTPNTEASAAEFGRQTMGSFFAYIDSIGIDVGDILSLEAFVSYLEKRLTCFEIIKYFGSAEKIDEAIKYLEGKSVNSGNYVQSLKPLQYIEQVIATRCTQNLLKNTLKDAAQKAVDDAKEYIENVTNMCRETIPMGREDIFAYYKQRVTDRISSNDIGDMGKICDFEGKIISLIGKIINEDSRYSLPLEEELAKRNGPDAKVGTSQTIVNDLNREEQYFTGKYNYLENVDVGGRIIFMDEQSDLWRTINRHDNMSDIRVFDMPENSEIDMVKIYTYND